jgi:hypothetical protein
MIDSLGENHPALARSDRRTRSLPREGLGKGGVCSGASQLGKAVRTPSTGRPSITEIGWIA